MSDSLTKLCDDFRDAMLEKAQAAEAKYGYRDGWLEDGWEDYLRAAIREHVEKGDPRDVAVYCAFAWYHGWSLAIAHKHGHPPRKEATMDDERLLSAEELAGLISYSDDDWHEDDVKRLLDHIDAQAAQIASLETQLTVADALADALADVVDEKLKDDSGFWMLDYTSELAISHDAFLAARR